jgi:hypothetical protein
MVPTPSFILPRDAGEERDGDLNSLNIVFTSSRFVPRSRAGLTAESRFNLFSMAGVSREFVSIHGVSGKL